MRHPMAAQLVAIFFATGMLYYHLFLFLPKVSEVHTAKGLGSGYSFGNDFYPLWLTSREGLLHHRNPYAPEITKQIQIGLFGRPLDGDRPSDPPVRYREFAYPAFVDLILWPLAYLAFPIVRLLLASLLPILTGAGVLLWFKAMGFRASPVLSAIVVLLTLCSYPILEALFAEQLGLVVGFLLAAAMAALAAEKYIAAGTLLAISMVKPQMVVLLVLFLFLWTTVEWCERRRLAVSFATIEILLCGSAFLVWPGWLRQWLEVLFDYRSYWTPPLVVDLLGSTIGPLLGPPLIAILIGIGIGVAWRARRYSVGAPAFWLAISLVLAVTVVSILPGQAVYDHIVLLPGIIFVAQRWRRLAASQWVIRWLLFLATGTLFWQWIASLAILAVRPLISAERFYSVAVFALPIRLAGSFPFVLLALLAMEMRQTLRAQSQVEVGANIPHRNG
jgi:hypothetical protein